jgi:acyl carrier protein
MNKIQTELQEIFRRVFDDELVITESTSAADVDGWDSIAHINLIIAIEKHFGLKFTANEIGTLGRRGQNVGGMVQMLAAKTGHGVEE